VQPVRRDGVAADLVEHVDDIGVGDVADPASAPSIHERDPTTAVPILAAVANDDQRGALLRFDRGLGVHREPAQLGAPLPGAPAAKLVVCDVAPRVTVSKLSSTVARRRATTLSPCGSAPRSISARNLLASERVALRLKAG